jgi:DNA mismatch endonuclease (patch repair protein)
MQANRSRDTKPELRLRKALHAMGLRYRVCTRPLPEVRRTVDIVFRKAKVAVEVRGCFWHGCPEHYRAPSSNSNYWADKVQRNVRRDSDTAMRLAEAGWTLAVVWEHDDLDAAAESIAEQVKQHQGRS